jgi:hypothetical protein
MQAAASFRELRKRSGLNRRYAAAAEILEELRMIRLTLVDQHGVAMTPEQLATVDELREAQERARTLIRECERLVDKLLPKRQGTGVPYS